MDDSLQTKEIAEIVGTKHNIMDLEACKRMSLLDMVFACIHVMVTWKVIYPSIEGELNKVIVSLSALIADMTANSANVDLSRLLKVIGDLSVEHCRGGVPIPKASVNMDEAIRTAATGDMKVVKYMDQITENMSEIASAWKIKQDFLLAIFACVRQLLNWKANKPTLKFQINAVIVDISVLICETPIGPTNRIESYLGQMLDCMGRFPTH